MPEPVDDSEARRRRAKELRKQIERINEQAKHRANNANSADTDEALRDLLRRQQHDEQEK